MVLKFPWEVSRKSKNWLTFQFQIHTENTLFEIVSYSIMFISILKELRRIILSYFDHVQSHL